MLTYKKQEHKNLKRRSRMVKLIRYASCYRKKTFTIRQLSIGSNFGFLKKREFHEWVLK